MKNNEMIKVSDSDYFAIEALNFSTFRNFLVSGKNYIASLEEKIKVNDAMLLGSLIHAMLLDAEGLKNFKKIPDLNLRTKADKELLEKIKSENEGKTLISEPLWERAIQSVSSLSPIVKQELTSNIDTEQTILWDFEGINCKSKLDIYNKDTQALIDVKTTSGIADYEKLICNRYYYLQLAFYDLALKACGIKPLSWKIIFIETESPYDSIVCDLNNEYMDYAKDIIQKKLREFAFCVEISGFHGISDDKILTISKPKWLF